MEERTHTTEPALLGSAEPAAWKAADGRVSKGLCSAAAWLQPLISNREQFCFFPADSCSRHGSIGRCSASAENCQGHHSGWEPRGNLDQNHNLIRILFGDGTRRGSAPTL